MKVLSINANVSPRNIGEKQPFKSHVIVTVKHPDTYAGGLEELYSRAVKVALDKKAIKNESDIFGKKQRISNEIRLDSTDIVITEKETNINDRKWYEIDINAPEIFKDRTSELEKI